jgi:hypothetical protein
VGAGLVGPDSALNGLVHLALPAKLRTALAPVIDEAVKKALEGEKDKGKRDLLAGLLQALTPTLKSAELDAGFDIRGPGAGGLYTVVAGVKVKDGAAIEKALRDAVLKVPQEERKGLQVDFDKAGDVRIHRVTPDKVDEQTRQLFGDNPFFFAARDDAVLMAAGAKGLEALKGAVAAAPAPGKPLQLEVSLARLAKVMAREQKAAPEAARKAFAADKGGDKIRVTLEGGKSLQLRLSLKPPVVTFLSLIDKAKKNGE